MSYALAARNTRDLIKSEQIGFDMNFFYDQGIDGICKTDCCIAGAAVLANCQIPASELEFLIDEEHGPERGPKENGFEVRARKALGITRKAAGLLFYSKHIQSREHACKVLNRMEALHGQNQESRLLEIGDIRQILASL